MWMLDSSVAVVQFAMVMWNILCHHLMDWFTPQPCRAFAFSTCSMLAVWLLRHHFYTVATLLIWNLILRLHHDPQDSAILSYLKTAPWSTRQCYSILPQDCSMIHKTVLFYLTSRLPHGPQDSAILSYLKTAPWSTGQFYSILPVCEMV